MMFNTNSDVIIVIEVHANLEGASARVRSRKVPDCGDNRFRLENLFHH